MCVTALNASAQVSASATLQSGGPPSINPPFQTSATLSTIGPALGETQISGTIKVASLYPIPQLTRYGTVTVAWGAAQGKPAQMSLTGGMVDTVTCSCIPDLNLLSFQGGIHDVITFRTAGVFQAKYVYSGGTVTTSQGDGNLVGPGSSPLLNVSDAVNGPFDALFSNSLQSYSTTIPVAGPQSISLGIGDYMSDNGTDVSYGPLYPPFSYTDNTSVAITNIVPLDFGGNPVSNVLYCTASGFPLPVQGGVLDCGPLLEPYHFPWPLFIPGPIDYGSISANPPDNQLYVPVNGSSIGVLSLDGLTSMGEISNVNAAGVAVSAKSRRGFSSSNPVLMWDTASLHVKETLALGEGVTPGAIVLEPVNDFVYVFHQEAPLATVLRASDGTTVAQIALSGIAKEAVADSQGNIYAGIQGNGVYNVQILGFSLNGALGVTGGWTLGGGSACSGLAMDAAHGILFANCKLTPVISSNGALPPISPYQLQAYKIGQSAPFSGIPVFSGAVGAVFNPATEEVFSLQTDGTLTIGKETVSLSSNVSTITLYEERFLRATKLGVKSLALDTRTGDIYYTGSAAQSAQSGQAASARHAIYVFGNSPPAGGTGDSQTGDN